MSSEEESQGGKVRVPVWWWVLGAGVAAAIVVLELRAEPLTIVSAVRVGSAALALWVPWVVTAVNHHRWHWSQARATALLLALLAGLLVAPTWRALEGPTARLERVEAEVKELAAEARDELARQPDAGLPPRLEARATDVLRRVAEMGGPGGEVARMMKEFVDGMRPRRDAYEKASRAFARTGGAVTDVRTPADVEQRIALVEAVRRAATDYLQFARGGKEHLSKMRAAASPVAIPVGVAATMTREQELKDLKAEVRVADASLQILGYLKQTRGGWHRDGDDVEFERDEDAERYERLVDRLDKILGELAPTPDER